MYLGVLCTHTFSPYLILNRLWKMGVCTYASVNLAILIYVQHTGPLVQCTSTAALVSAQYSSVM